MLFPDTQLELELSAKGLLPVGIDEVGRGALAGPVVACAVAFAPNFYTVLPAWAVEVRDSKLLSAKKREVLADEISRAAVTVSLYTVGAATIDEVNILQATLQAMGEAVDSLAVRAPRRLLPLGVLVDGLQKIPSWSGFQQTAVGGDARHWVIAAASVVAKVYRDSLMRDLHETSPQYLWDKNKGYGTKAHLEAIRVHGLSIHHRKSFCKSFDPKPSLR